MSQADLHNLMQQLNTLNSTCHAVGGNVYMHKDAKVNIVGGVGGNVVIYDDNSTPDEVKHMDEREKERQEKRLLKEKERQQREKERQERQLQKERDREQREKERQERQIQKEKAREQRQFENKDNDDDNEPFPSHISVSGYIEVPENEKKHSFDNLNGQFFKPFEINGITYDMNRIISNLDDIRRAQILSKNDDNRQITGYPRSVTINGVKITKQELDAEIVCKAKSMMSGRNSN